MNTYTTLNFESWARKSNDHFIAVRRYRNDGTWTPFVEVNVRYPEKGLTFMAGFEAGKEAARLPSTDSPNRPGLYYLRQNMGQDDEFGEWIKVIESQEKPYYRGLYFDYSDGQDVNAFDPGGQWQGPIPEPEEG